MPPLPPGPADDVERLKALLEQTVEERDRAREAAAGSERRFQQILDAIPVAVSVMTPGGQMYMRNAKSREIVQRETPSRASLDGFAAEIQCYVAGTDELYPVDRLPIVRAIRGEASTVDDVELAREGRRLALEVSGSPVFDADGRLICGVAAFQDITQRRQAEAALRSSHQRLRSMNDHMLNGLITVDEDSVIQSVNPAASRMFGYAPEELIGRSLAVLLPPAMAAKGPGVLRQARAMAIDRITEWEGRRKNGDVFPFELAHYAFEDEDGRRYYAGHIRDISERREVERLKQEFISTISHELRTPLTSIRGSLGLLTSGVLGELPAEAMDIVRLADRNTVRLIELINDILDLDRLESGRMDMQLSAASVADIVTRSIEAVSAFAAQHQVTISTDGPDAMAWADAHRLVQVLVNLLSNAVKFSPPAAAIRVTTEVENGSVIVKTIDQGRGIPASHLTAVFDRFRQVEASDARKKGGTGLGLAICKAIVEQHGGAIGVTSQEGVGSTFWFRVPLASGV